MASGSLNFSLHHAHVRLIHHHSRYYAPVVLSARRPRIYNGVAHNAPYTTARTRITHLIRLGSIDRPTSLVWHICTRLFDPHTIHTRPRACRSAYICARCVQPHVARPRHCIHRTARTLPFSVYIPEHTEKPTYDTIRGLLRVVRDPLIISPDCGSLPPTEIRNTNVSRDRDRGNTARCREPRPTDR